MSEVDIVSAEKTCFECHLKAIHWKSNHTKNPVKSKTEFFVTIDSYCKLVII